MNKTKAIGLFVIILLIVLGVTGFAIYRNQDNINSDDNIQNNTENDMENNVEEDEQNGIVENNNESVLEGEDNMNTSDKKVLIAYFSWAQHTEKMANVIASQTGGELVQIERKEAYPTDYNKCTEVALEEKNNNERPEINDIGVNINDYDVIYVGYPNWWGDMPMPLYTFLENNDFSGKTVIPFMTSFSSGTSGTFNTIKNIVDGTVLDGIHIYQRDIDNNNYEDTMISWINGLEY